MFINHFYSFLMFINLKSDYRGFQFENLIRQIILNVDHNSRIKIIFNHYIKGMCFQLLGL